MSLGYDIDKITRDFEYIDSVLREKDNVREELIKLTREIIRSSSDVVHSVHSGEYEKARDTLMKTRILVDKVISIATPHPDLFYSGLLYNALSEYTEAYAFFSIVVDKSIPSFREINVPVVPFLQGIGDLIGELRRLVIKLLNELRLEEAERYLDLMEHFYLLLRKIDYPEPLIPGIRHKTDIASRLIEDTRVLLLSTKNSLRCLQRA